MNFYLRSIKLVLCLICFSAYAALAQTITISPVDNGPYTPGSSIAVKLTTSGSGCIGTNNTYNLYLSDVNGSFAAKKLIGYFNGFYTTFVNGTLPASSTVPGGNYRLQVTSTSPALNSNIIPLSVISGPQVTAALQGAVINSDPSSPKYDANNPVFGACNPAGNYTFNFNNSTSSINNQPISGTATTKVSIFNEMAQNTDANITTDATNKVGTFSAANTNYTVFVTTTNGTVVGTRAYMLINNVTFTNFGTSGTSAVCLGTTLTFTVDYQSATGIQNNFPGDYYTVAWGDGITERYTLCQIMDAGGKINHTYSHSSCGQVVNGQNNVFKVDLQAESPYCSSIAAPVTSYAKVSAPPKNIIQPIQSACTNTPVSFANLSNPGEDPNNTSGACLFSGAKYSWYVNNVLVETGYSLFQPLVYTFPTAGNYTIKLHLENNPSTCPVADVTIPVCVQDKPQPSFTFTDPTVCVAGGPTTVVPNNTFVINNSCYTNNKYTWTITPENSSPAPAYGGGTNANSVNPQFVFSAPGTYKVNLSVTDACGGIESAIEQRLVVNSAPTVTLQPAVKYCGAKTLVFDATTGNATRVVYGGTADPTTATYQWTVTPQSGAAPATFADGTSATDQYPHISFPGYGDYTVTVRQTQVGACGASSPAVQTVTIQQAPTVNAGADNAICAADNTYPLQGSISSMASITNVSWKTSGDGTFQTTADPLKPIYVLGANDKKGGNINLTLEATTNLASPCNTIPDVMVLNVTPTATVTPAAAAQSVCSGSHYTYTITSPNSPAYTVTYNWTATGSANATNFGTSGSGAVINEDPVNTSAITAATITYTITPTILNGNGAPCTGTPYQLVVRVDPLPVLTPTFTPAICSAKPVNIGLASNLSGTRYTWTSAITSAGTATGFQQQGTPTTNATITDVINNTGTTDVEITYTITPISSTGCPGTPVVVKVVVSPPPSTASAGVNDEVCNQTSYTLSGNTPAVGTGTWTESTGQVTFVDLHDPNTIANNLQPGKTYQFTWTINNQCNTSASTIQVIDNLPSNGGTAATAANPVCAGSSGTITLTGALGAVTMWQQSTDNGATWASAAGINNAASYSYSAITQTTIFRALVQNGNCTVANSQPVTVTVNQPTPAANAGLDQTLCNQPGATLTANAVTGFTGQWTQISGPAVVISSPTSASTNVTGLVGGNTYTFRWTINGIAPCGNSTDDVVVSDLATITNTISTLSTVVCSGATINLNGSAPSGGNGTYTYLWEQSADNGLTWTTLAGQTSQNATVVVTAQTTFRRTVFSALCSQVSNQISVGTQAAISNNTIVGTAPEICYNTIPGLITGSTPTGGGGVYFYRWEQSTDGVNFTSVSGATSQNYQPPALTATMTYRRIVSTSLCSGSLNNTSNTFNIKVNPDVKATFTATKQVDCAPFIITSQVITATADANASAYTWYANGLPIGTGLAFPGYRIDNDGVTVTIKLQVDSKFGCKADVFQLNFTTTKQIIASFTMDKVTGCGPTTVKFTNTSTPVPGATYFWDFGDGNTSTLFEPTHTFQPLANGRDIVYNVVLTPGGCVPTSSAPQAVTVYPAAPVAAISPNGVNGCGPFVITVDNVSPGTNSKYVYYLYKGTSQAQPPITVTNKNSVSFAAINPTVTTTYDLFMQAFNNCGVMTETKHIPITITPSGTTATMKVTSLTSGCAPFVATFSNFSTGGTTYKYTIYDAGGSVVDQVTTSNLNDLDYTFKNAGNYTVSVTAYNSCSPTGTESSRNNPVTVYASPVANFSANPVNGCKEMDVKFTNLTTGSSSPLAFKYHWDFGDGSTSALFEPSHTFDYKKSPYTVTLTATNNNGCENTITKTAYIVVNPPTFPEFVADPGFTTSIPNYHFAFSDRTTGNPVSWTWDFGDGSGSTNRNPSHTYADTGKYVVTLTTTSAIGCPQTITHLVSVTGTPGQLYVPNAFMPNSGTEELRRFTVKGAGIKQWRMRVFDNWGQLVFETTKLNGRGEPTEFWDGNFKGQTARQGVYAWEITATFINGQEWRGMSYKNGAPKRAGTVTLLR